jgi:hypothetical protein
MTADDFFDGLVNATDVSRARRVLGQPVGLRHGWRAAGSSLGPCPGARCSRAAWCTSSAASGGRPPWPYARSTARCLTRRSSPRRCLVPIRQCPRTCRRERSRSTPERRCAPSRRLKELCSSRGGSQSRGGGLEAGAGGSRRKPAVRRIATGAGDLARRELASWRRSTVGGSSGEVNGRGKAVARVKR